MPFEAEQREARRILDGLEQGDLDTFQLGTLVERADPALVYFIFTWLRTRYQNHSAAEGVLGRIAELCARYPVATKKMKEGPADPLVGWFEDAYEYRELEREELIRIVVEKLES